MLLIRESFCLWWSKICMAFLDQCFSYPWTSHHAIQVWYWQYPQIMKNFMFDYFFKFVVVYTFTWMEPFSFLFFSHPSTEVSTGSPHVIRSRSFESHIWRSLGSVYLWCLIKRFPEKYHWRFYQDGKWMGPAINWSFQISVFSIFWMLVNCF